MSFSQISKAVRQYKTFIVATHVNPDPDALSSQLAVAMYLKKQGKKVLILAEDAVPERYSFLPGSKSVQKVDPQKVYAYDAAIVVDCGDLGRVGPVNKILDTKKPLINIDHHITNDSFGTVNHVVPQASSTAEIIFEFLSYVNFKLDKNIASLLYLGIMTDTGSFRYENTTSRTHEVISQLMKFNLPVSQYYQRLYEAVPLSDIENFTKLMSHFHSFCDGQVITIELKRAMVNKFSEEFDLRDKIFSYLRTIKGAEVFVILTEQTKNKTRINLRSQTWVDVARLAAVFDGGGHSRASGCLIEGSIKQAREEILAQLKKILKKKI